MENRIKLSILTAFFLFTHYVLFAQIEKSKYWVNFTNKDNTPFSIDNPEEYLSERAIARRIRQGIGITDQDLPVDPVYLNELKNLGIQVINVSKWLNGAIVSSDDDELMDTLENYTYIASEPQLIKPVIADKTYKYNKFRNICLSGYPPYGFSSNQIEMIHGDYLHRLDFEGQGMLIAIQDAGFTNADKISSLQHIWNEERVIAMKDFVKDTKGFFESHGHGTAVFSIMGGVIEGSIYGTAAKANYALLRTEDGNSEYIIEEYNWICGAEFADSLGADIINSSLGYFLFDDSLQNHSYSNMNGATTPITLGADIAASKGIIVVTSAGNTGDDPWYYIIAPGDAYHIITVGAVDDMGVITDFSSRGPSFDKRIKPDVCAQGANTVVQLPDGEIIMGNGTSFSSPIIAGMAACLWQTNPNAKSEQVIEAIKESASQYEKPDSLYGYGIPNFILAERYLKSQMTPPENNIITYTLFPNPAQDYFLLEIIRPLNAGDVTVVISFYNLLGIAIKQELRDIHKTHDVLEFDDISSLKTGMYFIKIEFPGGVHTIPFVKIK